MSMRRVLVAALLSSALSAIVPRSVRSFTSWPAPLSEGRVVFRIRYGLPVGRAELSWQVAADQAFRIELVTVATVAGWLTGSLEERRISEGRRSSGGIWRTERMRRERAAAEPELWERQGSEMLIVRKGKAARYPADADATDLLALIFTLAELRARGEIRKELMLLTPKRAKAIYYEAQEQQLAAYTADQSWQLETLWSLTPGGAILQAARIRSAEEGVLSYERT